MLENYFKTTVQVLRKNKLYTGISLFGISFTLMVLMLASAVLENELGNNPPLSKKDRILFAIGLQGEGYERENVISYDSSLVDGKIRIDTITTTRVLEGKVRSSASSQISVSLYKDHLKRMKTPELTSVFVDNATMNVYPGSDKLVLAGKLTDESYWKVFDFEFVEGGGFDKVAVENQANIIILRENIAEKYFGKQDSYLGKEIIWGVKGAFRVTGIIRDFGTTNRVVNGDFFVPITWASREDLDRDFGYFGGCLVALMAKDKQQVRQMEEELRVIESGLEKRDGYDVFRLLEKNAGDIYAWNFVGSQLTRAKGSFLIIVFILLGLFLLIPVINLVNLNVTRVYERSSEIGVRKAFGAKTTDLLLQFLFESLVITFIGGLIGLILSLVMLRVLNDSEVIKSSHLSFNFSLLIIAVAVTFVFGIVSGFLPAWRISKTQVAKALKSGNI